MNQYGKKRLGKNRPKEYCRDIKAYYRFYAFCFNTSCHWSLWFV